ncbi:substrate-binding domain-containing protein [Salipaludibacillus daqingensis]|uniref:substrate-binding domain-containing protein n=1 Tax=Salipaludibacillus daqingensis TaxID=3041001 RepID=UPI002476207A|nr:substrate-binding domain-containing protein [Salipaludibacillus daqingensis]
MRLTLLSILLTMMLVFFSSCEKEQSSKRNDQLLVATTTSTYDSGLLDVLIPIFQDETGIHVKVIAVGSGQALNLAQKGEVDALLVHAPEQEEVMEKQGILINRHRVMHNDFVLLGPEDDPIGMKGLTIEDAFTSIQKHELPFYSRGDDSGTHMKEIALWKDANVEPTFSTYQETGQGMGETLRIAAEKNGYSLTDRGTFLFLQDSLQPLSILVEGDETLENIYHIMQVNPTNDSQINASAAKAFVTFFLDKDVQELIGSYGTEKWGEPLFSPHLVEE